jgi:hypothetical protein
VSEAELLHSWLSNVRTKSHSFRSREWAPHGQDADSSVVINKPRQNGIDDTRLENHPITFTMEGWTVEI